MNPLTKRCRCGTMFDTEPEARVVPKDPLCPECLRRARIAAAKKAAKETERVQLMNELDAWPGKPLRPYTRTP